MEESLTFRFPSYRDPIRYGANPRCAERKEGLWGPKHPSDIKMVASQLQLTLAGTEMPQLPEELIYLILYFVHSYFRDDAVIIGKQVFIKLSGYHIYCIDQKQYEHQSLIETNRHLRGLEPEWLWNAYGAIEEIQDKSSDLYSVNKLIADALNTRKLTVKEILEMSAIEWSYWQKKILD